MTKLSNKSLLPAGLGDLLPPWAEHEEALTARLLDCFAGFGYQRIKPPLVEFEDGLFDGVGETVAAQTFRVMDPISRRMMGVRADITPQIARIATTRLKRAPRPLRLSYAGEVLRVEGSQLRPERQFRQIGVELIGAAKAAMGDAEVILLAVEALGAIGVPDLSVDINVPALARALCDDLAVAEEERRRLLAALDRKDVAAIAEIDGAAADLLQRLLSLAGPADEAIAKIAQLALPGGAGALCERLVEVVELVTASAPELAITVDPVESRGFQYHTGISFTLFALGVRGEIGSGGRYITAGGEPATGFTLSMDAIWERAPEPPAKRSVFVPLGTPVAAVRALRAEGWVAVNGLMAEHDATAEARRLGCSHVWRDGIAAPVDG